jgi:1-phosphofructokinase family hexose kinase
MISTITLNPSIDKTVYVTKLQQNDTNRIIKVEMDAGGKGVNCSRMLKRLGCETQIVTLLGGDSGEFIKTVLNREAIPLSYVETARPTRTCIAIEEQGGVPPTTLNEKGGPVDHDELVNLLEMVKNIAADSSYVVLGGSVPLGLNQDVYNVLIQICVAKGCKTVLDTDGAALAEGIKAKPFMIKPNRAEAERLIGKSFTTKNDVYFGALSIAEMGIPLVIISMGKLGAVAAYEGYVYDVSSPKVRAVSTIGSGDSFVAGVVAALDRGEDIQDALRLGAAAGAAPAMSNATEIGARADVDRLLGEVKVTKSK